ncbi:MAG: SPFH domain-containing protein [Gemmatimonadota bacterium]
MGQLIFGGVIVLVAFLVLTAAAGVAARSGAAARLAKTVGYLLMALGIVVAAASGVVVIDAGEVGVRHAFGKVDPVPLLPGVRFVTPWSSIERYSTREEQFPGQGQEAERMSALSKEQMGMTVDAAVRWQIDPQMAPRIFTEIGSQRQIEAVVMNAIRNGVRDGMALYSINDISRRPEIARAMEAQVDSALVTRPRSGGEPFRLAKITAFFLRNLEPPQQVVTAINNKIAQEQQIETERHRVEVARLQSEQQKLLNQTLTPEALTKQYLEVLHDMKGSNNLIILVPTGGGLPILNLGELRKNLNQ